MHCRSSSRVLNETTMTETAYSYDGNSFTDAQLPASRGKSCVIRGECGLLLGAPAGLVWEFAVAEVIDVLQV